MGGNSSWPLLTTPTKTYQALDTVSLTHGRHTLKFGGEFRHGGTELFRASDGKGTIFFDDTFDPNDSDIVLVPGLVNFFQGNFGDQRFASVLTGDIARHVTMTAFGAFVSDDWRIAPRLT